MQSKGYLSIWFYREIPSDIDSAEANQQLEDVQNLIEGFSGSKKELAELNKKLQLAEARVEAS